MIRELRRKSLAMSVLGASCIGMFVCAGCNSLEPSQDAAPTAQSVSVNGIARPSQQQQAQIIQNIQNSPSIPQDAKAGVVQAYQNAMQSKQQASSVQTGAPSKAELQQTIQSIQNNPNIKAADKVVAINQIKQMMPQ